MYKIYRILLIYFAVLPVSLCVYKAEFLIKFSFTLYTSLLCSVQDRCHKCGQKFVEKLQFSKHVHIFICANALNNTLRDV